MTKRRLFSCVSALMVSGSILALTVGTSPSLAQNVSNGTALSRSSQIPSSEADILDQISRESQRFYQTLQRSFVTVEIDSNPLHLLPKKLQKPFLTWEKYWVAQHDFRANPNARGEGPPEPRIVIKPDLKSQSAKAPVLNRSQKQRLVHINHHAAAELFLIRHFLFETHPLPPQEFWPEIQLINARLESLTSRNGNTVRGLIVGPQGYIVVPSLIAPPDDRRPITVWNARGKKFTAHILGVKPSPGVTILALKTHRKIPGIPLILHAVRPAELLFAVNATAPSAHWVMPLGEQRAGMTGHGRNHRKNHPELVGLMGVSPAFAFNLRGHLAALNLKQGFFPLNNNWGGLRNFILTGSPQTPRFGIQYAIIAANDPLRKRIADLGHKSAMRVIGTFPHSPAARAGVKNGDIIIAIDGLPILDFPQIHRRIEADPQHVELTVLRHGKTQPIIMSLRHAPPPH